MGFERFTRYIYRAEKSRLNDCRSFLLEGEQSYDREPKSEDYQITSGWERLQGYCQQAGHVSEYSKVVLQTEQYQFGNSGRMPASHRTRAST